MMPVSHRKPTICRLLGAQMDGVQIDCSRRHLHKSSLMNLRVTVVYEPDSGAEQECLTAVFCGAGMSRDVWTAESIHLGPVALKLTEQSQPSTDSVNAKEMQMYNTEGTKFQNWCAKIYFNQPDLEVKMPGKVPWNMTNSTKSNTKGNTVFQLMVQEELLDLNVYLKRLQGLYGGEEDDEARSRAGNNLIKATGDLLRMVMDMILALEGERYRLKDGTLGNIGVRLGGGGLAESVRVLDVEAIVRPSGSKAEKSTRPLLYFRDLADAFRAFLYAEDRTDARHGVKLIGDDLFIQSICQDTKQWPTGDAICRRWIGLDDPTTPSRGTPRSSADEIQPRGDPHRENDVDYGSPSSDPSSDGSDQEWAGRPYNKLPPDMHEMIGRITEEHLEPKGPAKRQKGSGKGCADKTPHRFLMPLWYMQQIWAILSFLWVALRDERNVWKRLCEDDRVLLTEGDHEKAVRTPKVLIPSPPDNIKGNNGHRYFVNRLTPAVRTLVQNVTDVQHVRASDSLPVGFPTETTHIMTGVLPDIANAVLEHICLWDAPEPAGISWNHSWWWMRTIETLSDGSRAMTGSRLTAERKQRVLQETLHALNEYQERKDRALKARSDAVTSHLSHRAPGSHRESDAWQGGWG